MKKEETEVKVGDAVHIFEMVGEPQYTDAEGVVEFIDDIGQLHGTWGGCAIDPRIDSFKKI